MTFKYTLVSKWITRPFEKKIDSMLSKIKHFFLRMLYLKAFYSLFVELSQSVFIELLFKMPHIVLNIKLISNMFHTLKHLMYNILEWNHENDQPAAGSDSAKPCTFGEIWLANSGDWVFLGVGGFRCKLRSWTLLLVLQWGIQKWIEFKWSNTKPFQTQKYKKWHKRCARWSNFANKDNLYHSLLITLPFANLNDLEFKDSHSKISHGYINRININLITFAPSDKTYCFEEYDSRPGR